MKDHTSNTQCCSFQYGLELSRICLSKHMGHSEEIQNIRFVVSQWFATYRLHKTGSTESGKVAHSCLSFSATYSRQSEERPLKTVSVSVSQMMSEFDDNTPLTGSDALSSRQRPSPAVLSHRTPGPSWKAARPQLGTRS